MFHAVKLYFPYPDTAKGFTFAAVYVAFRSAPPSSKFFSVKSTPDVQYNINPPSQETSHLSPVPLNGNSTLLVTMSCASQSENDSKVSGAKLRDCRLTSIVFWGTKHKELQQTTRLKNEATANQLHENTYILVNFTNNELKCVDNDSQGDKRSWKISQYHISSGLTDLTQVFNCTGVYNFIIKVIFCTSKMLFFISQALCSIL